MKGLSLAFVLLTFAELLTGGTTEEAFHLLVVAVFADSVDSYLSLLRNQYKLVERLNEVTGQ